MLKCIKNVVKNFALRSDMFAAPATLRFGGQTSYESVFGGVLSLAIVIAFAVIFYSSFLDVINKVVITATTDTQTDPYNTIVISDLTLAIGIDGVDFKETQRYFEIVLTHQIRPINESPQRVEIAMESCNKENWKDIGTNFDKLFDVHEMDKMLCPKQGEDLALEGFAGSDNWQTLQVRIQKCVNRTGITWACHSQADIDSYVSTYEQQNDYFQVKIFVVDTIFTPLQKVYTQKSLEEQIFCAFSSNIGSRGTIKLGDYNITTDESIWPFSETTEEIGHYITDYRTHTVDLFSSHYVKLTIEKDQTVFNVERAHGKFDEMLSYVGGLFALIFGFIVFFIGSYTEYRYEIAVAESTFTMDESGKKVKEKNFGFFTFLKYSLYDWINSLGFSISWHEMEQVNKAREEAVQQMDVRLIIKKLERAERVNQLLLKERNHIPTLQKMKKYRKIAQYYNKVLSNTCQQAATNKIFNIFNKDEQIDEFSQTLDNFSKEDALGDDEIPSDFDSDDEQAQKQILLLYQSLKEDQNSDIGKEILSGIPKSMKRRLRKLEIRQAFKNEQKELDNAKPISANNTQIQIHTGRKTNQILVKQFRQP